MTAPLAKIQPMWLLVLITLTWVSWFNNHRLMGPLGYIPPAEAEANYYRQLAEQSAVAA